MNIKYLSVLLLVAACGRQARMETVGDSVSTKTDTAKNTSTSKELPAQNCGYDNPVDDLGMGLVIAPEKFVLYNDSLLQDEFVSVNMMRDEDSKICSKFSAPEYGIMHFACIDSTDQAYKVITTNATIKFLPRTGGYSFKPWSDYLLQSYGVKLLFASEKSQKLQLEPTYTSGSQSVPDGYDMFCAIAVEGDWLKVTHDCFYNREENEHAGEPCHAYISDCNNGFTGWHKWRSGNQLLVEIYLIP